MNSISIFAKSDTMLPPLRKYVTQKSWANSHRKFLDRFEFISDLLGAKLLGGIVSCSMLTRDLQTAKQELKAQFISVVVPTYNGYPN